MALDFCYEVTDVKGNKRDDEAIHDHICDECGEVIKEMCDVQLSGAPDCSDDEVCETCKEEKNVPIVEDEEESD